MSGPSDERLFAFVEDDMLRRSHHNSVQQLGSRHPRLDQGLEHSPETLHLDQECRRDPRIPRQAIKANLRRGTLGSPHQYAR